MEKEKRMYHVFNGNERVAIIYAHNVVTDPLSDLCFYEESGENITMVAKIPSCSYTRYDNINRTVPPSE